MTSGSASSAGSAERVERAASRSPAFLAALASAAVPGLDPVSARSVTAAPGAEFDVAFVVDDRDRHWVVRAPRTAAAGARADSAAALLALLARRLPFQVPLPTGFAPVTQGRAAVYPYLPGRPLHLPALPAGAGLAADVGRAVAAVHNLPRGLFDEAGMPSYEADAWRARRLSELDRAAATGHVPTGLLARWEEALDDVSLWRFAPTPVHGDLAGHHLLALFESDEDATTGQVSGIVGWEDARVGDPADDLAAIADFAPAGAVESVFEAYAQARTEPPDPHLRRRALLSAELRLLAPLTTAAAAGDSEQVHLAAGALRHLEERVEEGELSAPPPVVVAPKPTVLASPLPLPRAADPGRAGSAPGSGADPESATVGLDPGEVLDPTEAIPSHQRAKAQGGGAALEEGDSEPTQPISPRPAAGAGSNAAPRAAATGDPTEPIERP